MPLEAAKRDHMSGRLQEAEAQYRRILGAAPDSSECLHYLGILLHQTGRNEQALEATEKAISLQDDVAGYHSIRGVILQALGRHDEAVASHRRAVALKPGLAEAQSNLGIALKDVGLVDEAASCFRAAIALKPELVELHNNLGLALHAQGKFDEAIASYRRAIGLNPAFADAYNNLGASLKELGREPEAIDAYRRAIDLQPTYAEAHSNLGLLLQSEGRVAEAEASCRRAIELKSQLAEAHNNLGMALRDLGQAEDAVACFRRAIELRPDLAEAHVNLGISLRQDQRLRESAEHYAAVTRLYASASPIPSQRAQYANALSQLIHLRRHLCDWSEYRSDEDRILDLVRHDSEGVAPFVALSSTLTPEDQLRSARAWLSKMTAAIRPRFEHRPDRGRSRPRIGYVSADFREHAVASLVVELFERHDRSRFEIFAYSVGPDDGSAMRRRLAASVDHFVDVRQLGRRETSDLIHQQGIDILVDLTGLTHEGRTEVFAYRPAPIQVNFLGYPGTMGVDCFDYVIGDRIVTPTEHQPFYAERIVQLPDSYQPNDTRRAIDDAPEWRLKHGLPEGGFVFCCFNATYKITPAFFDIWMRLLHAVAGSVLWLLVEDETTKENLRREAKARGIGPERLVFGPRLSGPAHLARHRCADLQLDTLPYNAHTGTSDSLWAGLPLVTCVGAAFAGRVAASLLRAIGLPELVTESPADYEALALRLATNPALLAALRSRLAGNRTSAPLFDTGRFTRHIEAAYGRMWASWLAGQAPQPFAVGPL